MNKEYIYKKQADGRDSWTCIEKDEKGNVINKFMVYEMTREVALWKVRAILKQMGLIPSIETALNSLPENVKDIALSAWEYSSTINQYSPTVKLIQQTCNLTDTQMEDVFDNAEKINI